MGGWAKGCIWAAALVVAGGTVQASTRVKANNASNLNLGTSWADGNVPGVGDWAKWDSTVTSANAALLGGDLSWMGIIVTSPGGAVAIGGTNALTIGCQGIDLSAATADLSITNASLLLRSCANPVWKTASGRTLTINPGAFIRSAGSALSLQGSGTVSSPVLTNTPCGLVGTWATVGTGTSAKYAANSGGSLVGYAGVSMAASGVTDTTGATNYDVTAVGALGLGAAFNTLRYTGAQGTVTGAFQANGILNAGAGALTFKDAVTIGGDRELTLLSPDSTRTLTFSGPIGDNAGGASGLTIGGIGVGGAVNLSASNSYGGVTFINSGTVSIFNSNALGTTGGGTVIYYSGRLTDGACLNVRGGMTLYEPISIVGGEISGAGLTVANGAGETNTLAGPITISSFNHARIGNNSGGVLYINAPISNTVNSAVLVANGGLIFVNAPVSIASTLYFHGGAGTVVLNTNGNGFATAMVQQGNTLKLGAKDAIATNRNVVVGSSAASNADDAGTSNGRLDMGGVSQTINSLSGYLNGSGTVTPNNRVITNSVASLGSLIVGSANGDSAFFGLITDGVGPVALGKVGTGALLLANTNTFSGQTTLSGGSLVLSNACALLNSTLNCTNSGSLRFARGLTDFTLGGLAGTQNIGLTNASGAAVALTVGGNNQSTVYGGALSASGSLTKVGTGALTLAGTNSLAGTVAVTDGTLALGCDQALGSGARVALGGGTLDAGTGSNALGRLVVSGPGTLALGGGTCHLSFADCGETWGGPLNITGGLGAVTLRFGTDASGLTSDQLGRITLNGRRAWLQLNAQGYLQHVKGTVIRLL